MSRPIKILIVDDHAVVRKGLSAILETEADFQVIGEAENGIKLFGKPVLYSQM